MNTTGQDNETEYNTALKEKKTIKKNYTIKQRKKKCAARQSQYKNPKDLHVWHEKLE